MGTLLDALRQLTHRLYIISQGNMMRATNIVALCVLAALTSATLMEAADPEFADFWDSVLEETDAASPDDVFTESDSGALSNQADSARVLKHIADLRAFAIAAHDAVDDFKGAHGNSDAGLVHFLYQLGKVKYAKPQPPPKENLPDDVSGIPVQLPGAATLHPNHKVMEGNVVLQYAGAMKATGTMFPNGIGPYLIGHLNKAVLSGQGSILETYPSAKGSMVTIDYKRLGLAAQPRYLKKIAATLSKYSDVLHQVQKVAGSADTAAATKWLQGGQTKSYTSFYDTEVDKSNKVAKKSNEDVITAAHNAIEHLVNTKNGMGALKDAPIAGLKAAEETKTMYIPTREQMEKEAAKHAKAWVSSQAGDFAKKEVNHVVRI